jgi:hypothetical protein
LPRAGPPLSLMLSAAGCGKIHGSAEIPSNRHGGRPNWQLQCDIPT